jgi:hypothetical protein
MLPNRRYPIPSGQTYNSSGIALPGREQLEKAYEKALKERKHALYRPITRRSALTPDRKLQ